MAVTPYAGVESDATAVRHVERRKARLPAGFRIIWLTFIQRGYMAEDIGRSWTQS